MIIGENEEIDILQKKGKKRGEGFLGVPKRRGRLHRVERELEGTVEAPQGKDEKFPLLWKE